LHISKTFRMFAVLRKSVRIPNERRLVARNNAGFFYARTYKAVVRPVIF
jgi:hypothetical protein